MKKTILARAGNTPEISLLTGLLTLSGLGLTGFYLADYVQAFTNLVQDVPFSDASLLHWITIS